MSPEKLVYSKPTLLGRKCKISQNRQNISQASANICTHTIYNLLDQQLEVNRLITGYTFILLPDFLLLISFVQPGGSPSSDVM